MRRLLRGKVGIFLDHFYTALAVAFALAVGVACALSLTPGDYQFGRWAVGLGLLVGNGMIAAGLYRMMPPGKKVQALLVTSFLQAVFWIPLALVYIDLALSAVDPQGGVLFIWRLFYLCAGLAAGGDVLLGFYVFFGSNRWKRAMVAKVPWRW